MPFTDLNDLFEEEDFLVLPVDEEDPVGHVLSVTPGEKEAWDQEKNDPKAPDPDDAPDDEEDEEEAGMSSGAKVLLIVLSVLLVLIIVLLGVFWKINASGGTLSDLMFWVKETSAPSETVEPTATPTLDAVETSIPEETEPPASEEPEETEAPQETDGVETEEIPLSKVIPQGFASGLTTVNYHGVEQRDAPVSVDGSIVKALRELVNAAHDAGYTELILHNFKVASDDAPAEVAEHATGLCIDFATTVNGRVREFENATPEVSAWLKEHAHEYGFILRFPLDKEQITGVSYQPWHYTYVGVTVATDMYENDWCLEEYLAR